MANKGLMKLWWILLFIGGINWGLVGIFNFDVIQYILGTGMITRVIYSAVGIGTVILFNQLKKFMK